MYSIKDPIKFAKELWPEVTFYKDQKEVIYSVVENEETIVAAGNMLGKDFVSAFIALYFFLSRHPVRVVTTSADFSQLEAVLWGEIRRFIQTSRIELEHTKGGPLVNNYMHIRKILPEQEELNGRTRATPQRIKNKKRICGISYLTGRVTKKGEGMLGHHVTPESANYKDDGIPRTLFIADEASGVDDLTYERACTWSKRRLIIGNPYPCNNFFYRGVKGGDILRKKDRHGV